MEEEEEEEEAGRVEKAGHGGLMQGGLQQREGGAKESSFTG